MRDRDKGARLLVFNGEDAEDEADCFPGYGHDKDPAEDFAVEDRKGDMQDKDDAEDDCERDSSAIGRTVEPLGIGIMKIWLNISKAEMR